MAKIKFETKPCKWCGEPVLPIRRGRYRYFRRLCAACHEKQGKGEFHGHWKGGRKVDKSGYVRVFVASGKEKVLEHRLVWEQAHGPIPPGHEVHHISGDRSDNRLANLQLLSNVEHAHLHHGYRKEVVRQPPGWAKAWSSCRGCGTTEIRHHCHGYCRFCYSHIVLGCTPREQIVPRWSRLYDACTGCGTTVVHHEARGLCERCVRHAHGARPRPKHTGRWSYDYDACTRCGTTEAKHVSRGLCKRCDSRDYKARKRAAAHS